MDINVFLLCFNESSLLLHVINHYKKYLPSCKITIYDNESTDNSVELAKSYGCNVVSWNSNNIFDEYMQVNLRNNIWKNIKLGWIIMADMDEFLCVTEEELIKEMSLGTTMLKIKGYDMIGESDTLDLSDIDLQDIKKYVDNNYESKNLCFLRDKIINMNYGIGSHTCNPTSNDKIIYSSYVYKNKHMNMLGLKYLTNKITKRYERSEEFRKLGMFFHYTNDLDKIKNNYINAINNCKMIN